MSRVIRIHGNDKKHLFGLHSDFKSKTCYAKYSVAAAAFLIIGALIVIFCSSLCLTLPGVNVVQNVILPGVLPGCGALFLSLPFIFSSIHYSRKKNPIRKELIKFSLALISWHDFTSIDSKKKILFLEENLFDPDWDKEYSRGVISDMKKWYPEKKENQSSDQKKLLKALNELEIKIHKKN